MIESRQGNLLEADVEALVNTVNCVGVMGRGIALQFRKAFPTNFKAYEAACKRGDVQLGKMFVCELQQLHNPRLIINFPTKHHWREKSRMAHIEAGLQDLAATIQHYGIRSIAVPPLGSGLGGLEWSEVRPRIVEALGKLDGVTVYVYEPLETAQANSGVTDTTPPRMTPGRAALIMIMGRYLQAFMDVGISLLEIHKLMYFMQAAGEPLRLRFTPHYYGPYAENLRFVLREVEGRYTEGYTSDENPHQLIELKSHALAEAEALLADRPETQRHYMRVANLIEGFESPFGMELLATVHWVAAENPGLAQEDIADKVYLWNERKRMFTHEHLAAAYERLVQQGWLDLRVSEAS